MAKAWWRDSDYALFDRLTKERDEARAEVERLSAWHPHSAVGMLRLVEAEKERDEARAEVERLMHQLADKTNESTHFQVMCKREGEEIERLAKQVEALTDERDEARAIANAAVRELNAASAQAFIREQDVQALRDKLKELEAQLSGRPGGLP